MLYLLNSGYFGSHKQLEIYPPTPPQITATPSWCPAQSYSPTPAPGAETPPRLHTLLGKVSILCSWFQGVCPFVSPFHLLCHLGFLLCCPPRPPSPCPAPCLLAGFPLASLGTSSTRSSPSKIPFPTIQQPLSPLPAGSIPAVPCPDIQPWGETASPTGVRDCLPWKLWAPAEGAGNESGDTQRGSGPCSPHGDAGTPRRCARAWSDPAWPQRSSPPPSPVVFGWENAISLNFQRICQYKSLR